MKLLPLMFAFSVATCGLTSAHANDDVDRRTLQQQRSALDAQMARDGEVCEARFAVNACLDEARARHRAATSPLTARLNALDARERIERAAAQQERVAERQREFAAEEGRRRTQALKAPDHSAVPIVPIAPIVPKAPIEAIDASAADSADSNPSRTLRAADPQARSKLLRKQAAADAQTAQNNRDQLAARQRQQRVREQAQQQREEARARSGKKPGVALPLPTQAEVAAAVASAASAPRP